MSIRLSTTDAQLKATLASALTIGANQPYIMSFGFRLMSDRDTDSMLVALVDVDPGSTIARRVWTDPSTTPDSIYTDSSSGGVGSLTPTITTWYGCVVQRTVSGTVSVRFYPDTSSTTPDASGSVGGDTGALSGLDTVLIGDIQPSSRNACDMEITNLKVQTGVDGWDDTRCRYELDHFDFQSADGTERYRWGLETTSANAYGLNEGGGISAANLSIIAGTVANGSARPSQLEAVPASGPSPVFFGRRR